MYLARLTHSGRTTYFIRESYREGSQFKSRDIFNLGSDPSEYIVYVGGKGYYYDEQIQESLAQFGLYPTQDDLDAIFWDFLDPEIKRAIIGFQHETKPTPKEASGDVSRIHAFDMRRLQYLRFARTDQSDIVRLPSRLVGRLHNKSRDEIEQYFLVKERILKTMELKKYVFAIFRLQRFFSQSGQSERPTGLSRDSMDIYFIDTLCRLNDDRSFWTGISPADSLQPYLKRYAVMYFDYAFPREDPAQVYIHSFINRHRVYVPPEKVQESIREACNLFETSWQTIKRMDLRSFNRLYRKQALKHHPDQGGDEASFVRLKTLYEGIKRQKSR